jgi:hypothetical protein
MVYRKSDDNEKWMVISKGLPEPTGTITSILASNPKASGEFYYAVNNSGVFMSNDSGVSWRETLLIFLSWSKEYLLQHP